MINMWPKCNSAKNHRADKDDIVMTGRIFHMSHVKFVTCTCYNPLMYHYRCEGRTPSCHSADWNKNT